MAEIFKPAAEPVPIAKEGGPGKELLNESRAGLQAALLLDGLMPRPGLSLEKSGLEDVKNKIAAGSFETKKITNGSKSEREDHWKKSEHKDKRFEEQKGIWVGKTNIFLKNFEGKDEGKILERLNMKVDGAEQIYDEYFGKDKGKGDIGYFATRVAAELKPWEIEKYSGLLETVGGFYGKDSSEVARYLAEGVSNVKGESFNDFADAAIEQFNQGLDADGIKILNGVHDRNAEWLRNHGEEPGGPVKPPEQVVKPENEPVKPEKEKEIKNLIEPLLNFENEIRRVASQDHKLDINDAGQRADVLNSEWGKEMINKYNEGYKTLRSKIKEASEAKELEYIPSKSDELKEGDIVDLSASGGSDVLMMFQGRDEKGYYTFRQCGSSRQLASNVKYEYVADRVFRKIQFAGEKEKKTGSVVETAAGRLGKLLGTVDETTNPPGTQPEVKTGQGLTPEQEQESKSKQEKEPLVNVQAGIKETPKVEETKTEEKVADAGEAQILPTELQQQTGVSGQSEAPSQVAASGDQTGEKPAGEPAAGESSLGQQETSTQEPAWKEGDMVGGGRKIKKIEGGIATLVKFGQDPGVEEKVPLTELKHFDPSK